MAVSLLNEVLPPSFHFSFATAAAARSSSHRPPSPPRPRVGEFSSGYLVFDDDSDKSGTMLRNQRVASYTRHAAPARSSATTTSSSSTTTATDATKNELARLIQRDRSVSEFRNTFFPGRDGADGCLRFLYFLLYNRCLVFHPHHYAVQEMWLERLQEFRIPALPATASPSSLDAAFRVYYTQIFDDPVTRLSAIGHHSYFPTLAAKALCALLLSHPKHPLNSVLEMPLALLQAIMSSHSSPQLTAHFRDHWLCAQCYEKVLLDSTSVMLSDTALLDLLFHDDFVITSESPTARINNAEHRSLLRVQTDREVRAKLMVAIEQQRYASAVPCDLGGPGLRGDAATPRLPRTPDEIPVDVVERFRASDWAHQIQARAERTPTPDVMPSDYYVLCAYVLFVIEAMRFHANADKHETRIEVQKRLCRTQPSLGDTAAGHEREQRRQRLTVADLLTLFPVCMAVIRDENIDYVEDVLNKCEEASPGVCQHLIQHVAETVRRFMINPAAGSLDSYPPPPAIVLLLNIRTCIAPMLRRFDELRCVLQTTLSVGSGSFAAVSAVTGSARSSAAAAAATASATATAAKTLSSSGSSSSSSGGGAAKPTFSSSSSSSSIPVSSHYRQQRARFYRVDYTSLDALLFDVLLERTIDVNSFNSLAEWMHRVASGPAGVPLTPLDFNDHRALRERAEMLNHHYVAVCFFAVNTHDNGDMLVPSATDVDLFSLMGTVGALAARYPELNLNDPRVRHIGYSVSLGSFMVIHRDALWMLRHAMLNSVLTGEGRAYVKNTPVYPLLVSTYVARAASTPGLASMIAQHDHRALFLPYDSLAATPLQPLGCDPNVFALRCFVDTLCEWLDVPTVTLENGTPWRLGVPTPKSQHFGAMRFLHRLVDQLQLGHQASLVVSHSPDDVAQDLFDASSFLDMDDAALNAVRSFLQLRLPHSISHELYEELCELYPLPTDSSTPPLSNNGTAAPLHVIELAYLLHALRPLADAALAAFRENSGGDFCNEVLRLVDTLHDRAKMSEPVPSTRKRARPTHSSSSSSVSNSKSTRYNSSTVAFERGARLARVPILCTPEVVDRLPPWHPCRTLTDKHDRIAHANLLFYSASLVDALELTLSYRLLCNLRAACKPVESASLFAHRRYAGSVDEAVSNFRFVKSHYERNILKPRNMDGTHSVLLAYTPVEPMDALGRFLMRLDYRMTCGRSASVSPMATVNVADVLSPHHLCRDLCNDKEGGCSSGHDSKADAAAAAAAIDASKPLGEVDIHTALPVQIESNDDGSRSIYYAENSLLLFTSLAYSECQASLSPGARAALEMATAMTSYCNMAEYAADLRRRYNALLASGDSSAAAEYLSGRWFKRRSQAIRQRQQAAEKKAREREALRDACGRDLSSFFAALESE